MQVIENKHPLTETTRPMELAGAEKGERRIPHSAPWDRIESGGADVGTAPIAGTPLPGGGGTIYARICRFGIMHSFVAPPPLKGLHLGRSGVAAVGPQNLPAERLRGHRGVLLSHTREGLAGRTAPDRAGGGGERIGVHSGSFIVGP